MSGECLPDPCYGRVNYCCHQLYYNCENLKSHSQKFPYFATETTSLIFSAIKIVWKPVTQISGAAREEYYNEEVSDTIQIFGMSSLNKIGPPILGPKIPS